MPRRRSLLFIRFKHHRFNTPGTAFLKKGREGQEDLRQEVRRKHGGQHGASRERQGLRPGEGDQPLSCDCGRDGPHKEPVPVLQEGQPRVRYPEPREEVPLGSRSTGMPETKEG
jgi:hypothetical protein